MFEFIDKALGRIIVTPHKSAKRVIAIHKSGHIQYVLSRAIAERDEATSLAVETISRETFHRRRQNQHPDLQRTDCKKRLY